MIPKAACHSEGGLASGHLRGPIPVWMQTHAPHGCCWVLPKAGCVPFMAHWFRSGRGTWGQWNKTPSSHLDPERGGRSGAVLETGSALPSGLPPSLILSWVVWSRLLSGPPSWVLSSCSLTLAGRMKCCREATGLGNQEARGCLAVGLKFYPSLGGMLP